MNSKYNVVITTYSKAETGTKIIDALLLAKLAACVQVLPIKSFYTWKGTVAKDDEHLVLIKAKTQDFEEIQTVILKNHDYEIPEVISVPIEQGFAGYFKWLDEVTR